MTALKVNDKVHGDIIVNGYWKDSFKGQIIGETSKFWIVESGSHHFMNHDKGGYVSRRFSKSSCRLTKRNG